MQVRAALTRATVGAAMVAMTATLVTATSTVAVTTDDGAPSVEESIVTVDLAAAEPSADRLVAREAEPVVLTGAQLPGWSGLSAFGLAAPYPGGSGTVGQFGGQVRNAHHGTLVAPPATVNVDVDEIAAYAWDGLAWVEIPVQVDERFPYFLANARSDFAFYSGVDEELTYAWNPTAHSDGHESWKRMFGECETRYAQTEAEVRANDGVTLINDADLAEVESYYGPMADPAVGLDNDDEVVFLADDAGGLAPADQPGPSAARDGTRQQVAIPDPLTGLTKYVYLFLQDGGSSFTHENGYVDHQRHATADWIADRNSWSADDPEKLGTSNTGYGANLPGTACVEADGTDYTLGAARNSTDRFPLDGMTITTDDYEFVATGRWMKRSMRVAKPGLPGVYGEDLIDRWKGRAFQQSPDSNVSLVGFEDEQVNWEANASLLGWRSGPIRTIREVWGADSGTNVTKTETFYPSAIEYRYRVRVHPIPSDGLYTSWDYNHDVAACYFDAVLAVSGDQDGDCAGGVPIDGVDDEQFGNIDGLPNPLACNFDDPPPDGPIQPECEFLVDGVFVDIPDPTTTIPTAVERWEQVSGVDDNGSLVYIFEFEGATSATNAAAVPYYRDDACLDDGTGDDPSPRPFPGDNSMSPQVYGNEPCVHGDGGNTLDRQGAFGSHGLHFFITQDSDNVFGPKPVTEIDGSQWVFPEPTSRPTPIGEPFAQVIRSPLRPVVVAQPNTAAEATDGQLRGGVSRVDGSWHIGAAAGQYASASPPGFAPGEQGGTDRGLHSSIKRPSYGMESRNWFRAMVLEDGDGRRWALVSNDLYIPQDLINRRVAAILAERDLLAPVTGDPVTGITEENLTISVSHSHTSPFYSSSAPGVWVFEDVFDVRFFEWAAQRMADAVADAVADMRPVQLGAAQIDVTTTKRNPEGPSTGFAGEPAAYSDADTDSVMSVVRVDDVSGAEPELLANWFVWGRHPEDIDGNDLQSAEWVNAAYRFVDRELGGTTLFSQSDTGGSEIAKDARVLAPETRQEFDHKEYNQVDRVARQVADRIIAASDDVARAAEGLPALAAERVVAPRTDLSLGVMDLRFAPPSYRPTPTVSNCRTEESFDGTPGIPIAGLPDCEDGYFGDFQDATGIPLEDGSEAIFGQLPTGATIGALRDAGVPVPDNYGGPSYAALQESLLVHLQAIRLGDIAVTVCPCEMFSDTGRNIRSRINAHDEVEESDFWYGWDWNANYELHPEFEPGIAYTGKDSDGDGVFDEGHGPLTLPDANGEHFCVQNGDTTWTCKNPRNHAQDLAPISDQVFRRWKARIYNDATGWDDLIGDDIGSPNSFESESEPNDPAEILGNWTHEELHPRMTGGGYEIVIPVSMTNDYWGYQPPYSEYQNRDYYRKALSGLGPHSTDFMATRLTRMAAVLKGASQSLIDDKTNEKDLLYRSFENDNMRGRATVIGNIAQTYLPTYEAGLPADGGTGGDVVAQPEDITRFDATSFTFVGGSNYTDVPEVAVQRCIAGDCTLEEHFEAFGDGWAETHVLPDFPDPGEELAQQEAGQFVWEWTATFEAYSSDQDEPDLQGVLRDQVPEGTYRFVVRGCHRNQVPGTGPTPPDPTDYCGAHDPTGRVAEYTVASDTFEVSRWDGITVDDLRLDGGTVSFATGPDYPVDPEQSNMELTTFSSAAGDADQAFYDTTIGRVTHAGRDVVNYPNSYDSPFAFITARDDAECGGGGCSDQYPQGGTATANYGDHRELFCFHCHFQTWADTGVVETATVTIRRFPSGTEETVPASWNVDTQRWETNGIELFPGDEVFVAGGGVLDNFGETNQPSDTITVPLPEVTISGTSIVEGDSGTTDAITRVSIDTPTDDQITVQVTADGTGDSVRDTDWSFTDGPVVIPAFATGVDVPVTVVGDADDEDDEVVTLTIESVDGAVLGTPGTATVAIVDDDPVPAGTELVISDAEVLEGDAGTRDLVFTVSLSTESSGPTELSILVTPDTATDPDDLIITSPAIVTIADGTRSATLRVPVVGDLLDEDDETITATIETLNGQSVTLDGDLTAIGTIVDDDIATLSVADADVVEDTGPLVFDVTLSGPSVRDVQATVSLAAGSATTDDADLTGGQVITINAGLVATTVSVPVTADVLDEPEESFALTLTDVVGANEGDLVAFGTILDDDAPPGLSIDDVIEFEGDDGVTDFVFTVELDAVSGRDVEVQAHHVDASALAGFDYEAVDDELVIPAGTMSIEVAARVFGDTEVEPDERFHVVLEDAVHASVVDGVGQACILDDDEQTNATCDPIPEPDPDPDPDPSEDPTDDPSEDPSDDPDEDPTADPSDDPTEDDAPVTGRLAGEDRYATAITISRDRFPEDGSANVVVLARGDEPNGFADALAGTPLAVRLDAPLLITEPGRLVPSVRAEIARVLGPGGRVIVLGGPQAIVPAIEVILRADGHTTERLQGASRVETAIAIAERLGNPDTVFIASGDTFADALPASAAAVQVDGAVLLTRGRVRNAATDAWLDEHQPGTIHAVGGPAADPYPEGIALSGADRLATAVAVAERIFTAPPVVGVARSDTFPDALTGGAHTGARGGPVLLSDPDGLSAVTRSAICGFNDTARIAHLYGGFEALAPTFEADTQAALDGTGCNSLASTGRTRDRA